MATESTIAIGPILIFLVVGAVALAALTAAGIFLVVTLSKRDEPRND